MRIRAELDTAREEIWPSGELRGRLRVAVPSSFGPTHFAPALADLARRHPLLHVHARFSDRYVDLVSEGFDCGIRVGNLANSNLVARRIGSFSVGHYASPDDVGARGASEKPDDVAVHPALMIGTKSWKFGAGKKTLLVHPKGRFKADSVIAIAEATAAVVGIAALSDAVAESCVARGSLVAVMTGYTLPKIGIYVVRAPGQHQARKVRVLIELLHERFGASAA